MRAVALRPVALRPAILLLTLLPVLAAAEETRLTRKVAVLPFADFSRTADGLWTERSLQTDATGPLLRYVLKRLAVEPGMEVVRPVQVRNRIRAIRVHREGAQLGLERMQLGLDLYKAIRVKDAIPHLEQAYTALISAFYDVVHPERMAELALTLALCYQEDRRHARAHVRLKDVLHWAPRRQFKRGFYSQSAEQALDAAWVDFMATFQRDNPVRTAARIDRLMKELEADVLVYGWLEATATGAVFQLVVHDTTARPQRVSFPMTGSADDLERLDRFISRWTTCLPSLEPVVAGDPSVSPQNNFFLDTAFTYSLFTSLLRSDALTSSPFHNLGMAINGEWQFLRGLGTFLQLGMLMSSDDASRDLRDTFPTVRLTTGVSYAFNGPRWRIFARVGWEFQFLGTFEVTRSPWCKFDRDHALCQAGEIDRFSGDTMMGFHAGLGGHFFATPRLYVVLRSSVTAYIIPNDDTLELNFPLSFDAGIGYTF